MMYAKLIFRNARRSARDYLVYIVTMTICVTLFYSFLSISSRYYRPDIGSAYDFTMLSDGMKLSICAITLLLLFLIRFVNRCMLRCRQREFAVQAILGMEQRTIGRLFFGETLLMGAISMGIGIFLGMLCSQFITAMLMTSYGNAYEPTWMLFPDTVLLTVGFFSLSFLVMGLWNHRAIQKTSIIRMLSADRENEPAFRRGRWIVAVLILFELFVIWMLITGIQNLSYYYDIRYPLPAQLMYWGNVVVPAGTLLGSAVWLVKRTQSKKPHPGFHRLLLGLLFSSFVLAVTGASVPPLQRTYYLPLHGGILNKYLLFVLVDLIVFLSVWMYLASSLIAAWKERSPARKYHRENLFFFGQFITKLNTTSKTMTLISVTLVLSMFLFLAAPILVGWASGYLEVRSLYDVQIFSSYRTVYEEDNLPHDDYEIVTDFLKSHAIETAYDCTFSLYLPNRDDFHNRVKYDFPAVAMALSDYNTLRTMLGWEPITLAEREFTTQWKSIATDDERELFLSEHTSLHTDAGTLTLSPQASHEEPIGETVYNSYTNVVFVLPDSVCDTLLPVMQNRYISTTETISYEDARQLERVFSSLYPEYPDSGVRYGIRLRTLQINSAKANNFVLQASMLYGAVVLMVICLTVLSLQQLLDAGQYRYRFSVLRNLGVEEKNIQMLVLKQLGIWFGLPIISAILVSAVIIAYFIQTISAEIAAYIGFSALLLQAAVTVGILVMLLVCYFLSTWILFRRAVGSGFPKNTF